MKHCKCFTAGALFTNLKDSNWVDIEYQYFSWLKRLFKAQPNGINSKSNHALMLQALNTSYTEIIKQLEKHLITFVFEKMCVK